MANRQKLRSLIDVSGIGLEIGPSFDPVVPKHEGHRVEIVDHLTAADLRRKYHNAPGVDLSRIEEVDFVFDGRGLIELIGRQSHYDYIVASHVIEHTVDILGFLLDCQQLLKPGGTLALAVPDMRFSFDCLRPVSTTGQVLQTHSDDGQRHAIGKIFDEIAYNVLREGAIAWPRNSTGPLEFFKPLDFAKSILMQYEENHLMFIDVHAWQFTPSSFRLIVDDLFSLSLIALREMSFDGHSEGEFFVGLSTTGEGSGVPRIELAQLAVLEQRSILVNVT